MPGSERRRIGFVGAGRVAQALAPALQRAGYAVTAVASRRREPAKGLAARLPGCAAVDVAGMPAAADLVFLTVPDDAIAAVAAEVPWKAGMAAVHCSGATEVDVLAPAIELGVDIGGFHPLQTFATPDVELRGITVAIEAAGVLLEELRGIAAALGCKPLRLAAGARPLYHASGAFGHNYLVTLVSQAVRLWSLLGWSENEALEALLPLAKASLQSIERVGVAGALTGPIARGDTGTVRRHIEALDARAPDLLPLYRELGRYSLQLTSLPPAVSAEITAILCESKEPQPCV